MRGGAMKAFSILTLLVILFISGYASAQNNVPPCPCDTLTLNTGTTGNDIVETLCPGGQINANFRFDSDVVEIFNGDLDYIVSQEKGLFCAISEDHLDEDDLELTDLQYQLCRESLVRRCGLNVNPIPALSEWGMIAAVGILGMTGLFFVARKRKAAV